MITIKEFLEEKVRLPSPKAIAIRILEEIKKDEDSFSELADIITSDPALTARILKVANSSFYGLAERVSSPAQAISVIGTQALKNLALSFVIFDTVQGRHQGSFDLNLFWRRAITSAVAAETVAKRVGADADDIFVIALLQDFGVLVLFLSYGAAYTEVLDAKRISGRGLHQEETRLLGFNHAEVGSAILKSWNLPESIHERIRTHHMPEPQKIFHAVSIINLADKIASIYHGKESNRRSIETQTILTAHYGFSNEESTALIDAIGEKARNTIDLFAIPPGNMKPFSQIMQDANDELTRLNYSYEQLVLELTQAKRNAEQLAIELKKANDSLRDLAVRDSLTGLYNHRYFQDALSREVAVAKRYNHQLSLLLLDIDFFKKINDTYGHPMGDYVLQEISTLLVKLVRNCDIVARYGGEEFAVILPQTGTTGAKVLAHRLRRGVEQHLIRQGDLHVQVTVSIGLASTEILHSDFSGSTLITQCDDALYLAKHNGRNRLEVATEEIHMSSRAHIKQRLQAQD